MPPPLWLLAAGLLGFTLGGLVGFWLALGRRRALARLLDRTDARRQSETEAMLDGVKLAFSEISRELVRRSGDELGRIAQVQLAAERRLQGQQVIAERAEFEARIGHVLGQLERMQTLIRDLERDRQAKFGELAGQLKFAGERAQSLAATTQRLTQTLANTRARGQWGERLAEDVLRMCGLVEHVSYRRQAALPGGARPDFTLLLPGRRLLHMDVKFPFDNYLRSLQAEGSEARGRLEAAFVRDVRARIAEVGDYSYVAPETGTLEFALLLIPNEPLFAAMLELDPGLADEALRRRVVLVSPLTLFAVLAIVRQSVESHAVTEAGREIVELLTAFRAAWADYLAQQDKLGQRLEDALRDFHALAGTRRARLDSALARLEGLRAGTERPTG